MCCGELPRSIRGKGEATTESLVDDVADLLTVNDLAV